jgi:protein involved in polysaccharide export with SLBB domain
MRRSFALHLLVALGTLLALAARPALAQRGDMDPNRVQLTRPALEELLRQLDAAATSSGYSGAIRDHARLEAALVRARLAAGDFREGDRIYLRVEGEPTLTDTFTVSAPADGPALTLPIVGPVPLKGVLHAELQEHMQQAIGRFVKDPVVQTRALIRVAVLGEVTKPGFYTVPTQTLVSDALMMAGGPTHDAKLENLRIERGNERVWEGQAMQQAIAEGKTLDQLSIQAGDKIEVPAKGSWFGESTFRAASLLLTIPVAIYGITRLF